MIFRRLLLVLMLPLLTACEMVYELLEIPDPQKQAAAREAEGRAVGSACRHAGRSLEDCYTLNPDAEKAAIFLGWREMNDYMLMNQMEVVPSRIPLPGERAGVQVMPRSLEYIDPPEIVIPPDILPPTGG